MLRHFVRTFQRSLVLHAKTATCTGAPHHSRAANFKHNHTNYNNRVLHRLLYTAKLANEDPNSTAEVKDDDLDSDMTAIAAEADAEYVQPYRTERETRMSANSLVEALRTRFRLTESDVQRVLSNELVTRAYQDRSLVRTLDELCMLGVTKRSFLDSPWLITLDPKRLETKIDILRTMPMRDINHFVPFLRLTVPRLRKLASAMNREKNIVPFYNRIYFIAEQLKMDPQVISMYLCKRLFILEMPFGMLEQNLQLMIDYNVSAQDILRDLWAFRYMPKSVQMRLERAKLAKKDKIMPWMVRCPEPILQRSLKLSLDELAVLGDKQSNVEYVAERLGFSAEHTKAIMTKHPQVLSVRVPKVKEILDYLLDEAGFTRYEVANVIRILCHSLETTKQRINQLKSIGCRPSSLVIVCRSKREYDKFLNSWMVATNK